MAKMNKTESISKWMMLRWESGVSVYYQVRAWLWEREHFNGYEDPSPEASGSEL